MPSDSRRFRLALRVLVGAVGALSLAAVQAGAQPAQKVKVFVFAQQKDSSGFVDPRNQDLALTVKDIREAIVKKKNSSLQVVEAQEQADIVLEITERKLVEREGASTTSTTYSKDGKNASSTTTSTKEHDVVLKAVMHVGDYTNELTGQCDLGYLFGGPFRQAAKNLVGSLEDWVKSNHSRLQLKLD